MLGGLLGRARRTRMLVGLLLVGLLGSSLPHAMAYEAPAAPQHHPDSDTRCELVGQRTQNARVFEEPDGSHVAELYPGPIHFRDEGDRWQAIDNSLVPSSRTGYAFENEANSYRLYLPEDLGRTPIRIESGGDWIEFQPEGASGGPTLSGNSVTYTEALPGVDLSYLATATGVKENLELAGPRAIAPVDFSVDTSPGLSLDEGQGGALELEKPSGKDVAGLDAPFMYDSNGEETARASDIYFELSQGPSDQTLTVVPDAGWLSDPERDWPVVIDPTVTFKPASRDCWIGNGSYASDANCGATSDYLRVGHTGSEKRRALVRFDLSSIPASAVVTDADLALHLNASKSLSSLNEDYFLRRVGKDWTNSVTWNKYNATQSWSSPGGDFGDTDAGRLNMGGENGGYKHFDPTWLVQDWVDGRYANNGVILKQAGESTTNVLFFASSNHADSVKWPKLTVTYTPPNPSTANLAPGDGTVSPTTTPTLSAIYDDPNAEDDGYVEFELYNQDGMLAASNATGPNTFVQPGQTSSWMVPAGKLTQDRWRARAYDGVNYSSWTSDPANRSLSIGGASINVTQWSSNHDTGTVAYGMTVGASGLNAEGSPAGPCNPGFRCKWTVHSRHTDGTGERDLGDIASGILETGTASFSETLTGTLSREVTDVRVSVNPVGDYFGSNRSYDSGWIHVSDVYPTGGVALAVDRWERHDDGTVSYSLTVDGHGAAQVNGPCERHNCSWHVDAYFDDGTTKQFQSPIGSGGLSRGTWSFSESVEASNVSRPNITHLRATLDHGCFQLCSDVESYVGDWVTVSDLMVDGVDATGLIDALAGISVSQVCNGFLFFPVNTNTTSPPDPYEQCETAVLSGLTTRQILWKLVKAFGIGILAYVAIDAGIDIAGNDTVVTDKPEGAAAASEAALDEAMPTPTPCLSTGEETQILEELDLPDQDHHFLTDKHKTYTDDFERIIDEFPGNHTLNEGWNIENMPHRGRHSGYLWKWVVGRLRRIADEADGDWSRFIDLFNRYIKQPILNDPLMLRKVWWDCQETPEDIR